jgi:VanZ family protein
VYGGWAAVLGWAAHERLRRRPTAWTIRIVLMAAGYGAALELLQGSLACIQRTGSWEDALMNLAGAVLGIAFFHVFRARSSAGAVR